MVYNNKWNFSIWLLLMRLHIASFVYRSIKSGNYSIMRNLTTVYTFELTHICLFTIDDFASV